MKSEGAHNEILGSFSARRSASAAADFMNCSVYRMRQEESFTIKIPFIIMVFYCEVGQNEAIISHLNY